MFAKTLRSRAGPRVLIHANVVAIRLEETRRAVRSVVARSLSGKSIEITARNFVLANGALEIARLLMHPLADGQAAPWVASKFLGRPLIDHLDCIAGDVEILDHEHFRQLFDNIYLGGYKYYPKIRLSPSTQQAECLVDVAAQFMYKTRFSEHLDHLKMFLRSVIEGGAAVPVTTLPKHLAAVAGTAVPLAVRYFRDRRSFKPRDAEVNLTFFCEQLPNTRSELSLSDTVDELGLRRLRVDWQIDGRELNTMCRFGVLIKQWLENSGLARVRLDPLLESLDRRFIANVHDGIHQMGVTRIGRTADEGFVDKELKVFDVENLFVAGAAVFPSSGFANPTFTAIALALRLVDRLVRMSR
jgi:choline dehydrogenase-like flavoprotein